MREILALSAHFDLLTIPFSIASCFKVSRYGKKVDDSHWLKLEQVKQERQRAETLHKKRNGRFEKRSKHRL